MACRAWRSDPAWLATAPEAPNPHPSLGAHRQGDGVGDSVGSGVVGDGVVGSGVLVTVAVGAGVVGVGADAEVCGADGSVEAVLLAGARLANRVGVGVLTAPDGDADWDADSLTDGVGEGFASPAMLLDVVTTGVKGVVGVGGLGRDRAQAGTARIARTTATTAAMGPIRMPSELDRSAATSAATPKATPEADDGGDESRDPVIVVRAGSVESRGAPWSMTSGSPRGTGRANVAGGAHVTMIGATKWSPSPTQSSQAGTSSGAWPR